MISKKEWHEIENQLKLDGVNDDDIAAIKKHFCQKSELRFFMAMEPPTKTHQEKKIRVVKGKPIFYEPAELKAVRQKLTAHLAPHVPTEKYTCGVRLVTKWCFPMRNRNEDGQYRITKPDTDNLQKLLKDVMTDLGFWTDDALVASEITEKFWARVPGIYIKIETLEENK